MTSQQRFTGVLVMVHGDDKGLVLPPRIANYQVVIVPCGIVASMTSEARAALEDACESLARDLRVGEIRVHVDKRDNYSPGWKFNHWEVKVRTVVSTCCYKVSTMLNLGRSAKSGVGTKGLGKGPIRSRSKRQRSQTSL